MNTLSPWIAFVIAGLLSAALTASLAQLGLRPII
jgi:hypothetical protein